MLATALGLAIAFLFWFLWYRSHKKKQLAAAVAGTGTGGTPELPGAASGVAPPPPAPPQIIQIPYPSTGAATVVPMTNGVAAPFSANPAIVPRQQQQQQQQQLAQTPVVPVHSTPSPGPSLTLDGPPAYVPPHANTQELHVRGMTPMLEGFQGYGQEHTTSPNDHGVSPIGGGQELDGTERYGQGHPGGAAGGLENCPPAVGL